MTPSRKLTSDSMERYTVLETPTMTSSTLSHTSIVQRKSNTSTAQVTSIWDCTLSDTVLRIRQVSRLIKITSIRSFIIILAQLMVCLHLVASTHWTRLVESAMDITLPWKCIQITVLNSGFPVREGLAVMACSTRVEHIASTKWASISQTLQLTCRSSTHSLATWCKIAI